MADKKIRQGAFIPLLSGNAVLEIDNGTDIFYKTPIWQLNGTILRTAVGATDYNPSTLTKDFLIAMTDTTSARNVIISTEDVQSGFLTNPRVFIIKNESGGAGTNNITISLESGTIDGNANYVMDVDNESVILYVDGTNGFIYANNTAGDILVNEQQIYHVASHGNDSNSGKNRANALVNSQIAYTKIIANETPTSTNRFVIYNPDAHEESNFITAPWINIYEPQTNYVGTCTIGPNSNVTINKSTHNGGSIGIKKTGIGASYFYAKELIGGAGTNILLDVEESTLIAYIDVINAVGDDIAIRVQEDAMLHLYTSITVGPIEVQSGATLYIYGTNLENVTFIGAGNVYYMGLKGGGIIEPILYYSSHPSFAETDTEIPDIKWVQDYVNGHPVTNLTGVKDVLPVTTDGKTDFTLSHIPIDDATLTLILNHTTHLRQGIDYNYTLTSLTWLDPGGVTLKTTDELVAHYNYLAAPGVVEKSYVSTMIFGIFGETLNQYDLYPSVAGSGGGNLVFGFTIPQDCVAISSIKIMLIPQTTPTGGSMNFDWRFGKDGQSKIAHVGQQLAVPIDFSGKADTHQTIDVTSYFAAAEAGDRCTCRLAEYALGIHHYLGIEIIYT